MDGSFQSESYAASQMVEVFKIFRFKSSVTLEKFGRAVKHKIIVLRTSEEMSSTLVLLQYDHDAPSQKVALVSKVCVDTRGQTLQKQRNDLSAVIRPKT